MYEIVQDLLSKTEDLKSDKTKEKKKKKRRWTRTKEEKLKNTKTSQESNSAWLGGKYFVHNQFQEAAQQTVA